MKKLINTYSERFQETDTTVREMYCIDFMDVDFVLKDVLDDALYDDQDFQKAFGRHWKQLNGCDALEAALSIASNNGGWLVFAETPIPRDIKFNADGTWCGYCHGGSFLQHVYATTLEEALERVASGAEQYVEQKISAARAEQGIPEPSEVPANNATQA